MSKKADISLKKLVRKLKSPYALGPSPLGMIAWVAKLIIRLIKFVDSLKK